MGRTPADRFCIPPVGAARGARGPRYPKFLEHIVILYFEKQYPKENSVIRLKSNILLSPQFFDTLAKFWAGDAADSTPPPI